MSTPLIATLQENCGYLRDRGWHQTAHLMTLAAGEIERLNERIRALEEELQTPDTTFMSRGPDARNQAGARAASLFSRR
jgi:hypothetical protein